MSLPQSEAGLRDYLLQIAERQAEAHGLDYTDGAVRGTIRNLIAVILSEWSWERRELAELRALSHERNEPQ